MSTECPNCGKATQPGSRKCSHCYEPLKAAQLAGPKDAQAWRCSYVSGWNVRCPRPGTISSDRGPDIRYYCRDHYRCQGDPAMGDHIVEIAYRHPEPPESSWKDDLIDDEMIRLGLIRRHDEPVEDHVARCRATLKSLPLGVRRVPGAPGTADAAAVAAQIARVMEAPAGVQGRTAPAPAPAEVPADESA